MKRFFLYLITLLTTCRCYSQVIVPDTIRPGIKSKHTVSCIEQRGDTCIVKKCQTDFYDKAGRVIQHTGSCTDNSKETQYYHYDEKGQLVKYSYGDSWYIAQYDQNRNLTHYEWYDFGQKGHDLYYEYTKDGKLKGTYHFTGKNKTYYERYSYDQTGRVQKKLENFRDGRTDSTIFTYNDSTRMSLYYHQGKQYKREVHDLQDSLISSAWLNPPDNKPIDTTFILRDAQGNRLRCYHAYGRYTNNAMFENHTIYSNNRATYQYNVLDSVMHDSIVWQYDSLGRLISQRSFSYSFLTKRIPGSWTELAWKYSEQGDIIEECYYSGSGHLSRRTSITYTYY